MSTEIERIQNMFRMKAHPEGGFYGSGSRSSEFLRPEALPSRYGSPRNMYSSIFFMVTHDSPSRFHRLQTDELWHFYKGDDLEIHTISDSGNYTKYIMSGRNNVEDFQYLVKRNTWLAATCSGNAGYSLSGCTLSPGFEFDDFELADKDELIKLCPRHEDLIRELT
ncbi:MAG: cupin domain-containing protein [Bacteroidetes bacterium]|nr:cupin domain-containing protein [Bacteroidota bacterium]